MMYSRINKEHMSSTNSFDVANIFKSFKHQKMHLRYFGNEINNAMMGFYEITEKTPRIFQNAFFTGMITP